MSLTPVKKLAIWVVPALALFLSGFIFGKIIHETSVVTTTVWMTEPPIGPQTSWREIARFSGSFTATTEPFLITTRAWRIRWSYGTSQYSYFSFFVYRLGETQVYVEMVSSTAQRGDSVTYIYQGQGHFYLRILAANVHYTIIIEAPN